MAGIIKNLLVRSLLYWIPMTSLPMLKTPSRKGNKTTKASRSYHQNRTKSSIFRDPMVDLSTQVAALTAANAALQSQVACEGQTNVLDCKRKVDLDVYIEGRTPVLERDNRFDLKPETLGLFLKLLDRKATDQGWNDASSTHQIGLFNIAQDIPFCSKITISITKDHNSVEMTDLRAQCKRFMIWKYAQY